MLAVIWTMPLATIDATVLIIDATVPIIDATVLISGLSLLILVAGPVLLVLGADEESSAASVMPSLAADPGSRGETRGGGGGGRGGGGWGGGRGGGGEDQGRTGRAASDTASSLHHRRVESRDQSQGSRLADRSHQRLADRRIGLSWRPGESFHGPGIGTFLRQRPYPAEFEDCRRELATEEGEQI